MIRWFVQRLRIPIVGGIFLGLSLGTLITSLSYFNDEVLKLTPLASSTLAVAVFGFQIFVGLALNPAIKAWRPRLGLTRRDTGLAVAIAVAACAWPGAGFFAYFTHLMAAPAMQYHTKPYWKDTQPFAYMPGGSADLAAGYVTDWATLSSTLVQTEAHSPIGISGCPSDLKKRRDGFTFRNS